MTGVALREVRGDAVMLRCCDSGLPLPGRVDTHATLLRNITQIDTLQISTMLVYNYPAIQQGSLISAACDVRMRVHGSCMGGHGLRGAWTITRCDGRLQGRIVEREKRKQSARHAYAKESKQINIRRVGGEASLVSPQKVLCQETVGSNKFGHHGILPSSYCLKGPPPVS